MSPRTSNEMERGLVDVETRLPGDAHALPGDAHALPGDDGRYPEVA
jgi:hypothetical protein